MTKKICKTEMLKYRVKPEDLRALQRFIDDTDDTMLKLDILGWMFDNLNKIRNLEKRDKKFHAEVLTFLKLIGEK